jgi:hypothetical protein
VVGDLSLLQTVPAAVQRLETLSAMK